MLSSSLGEGGYPTQLYVFIVVQCTCKSLCTLHTHTQCTCILIANHQLQMRIEEMIGTINISISIRFSFILPHSTRTKRNVTQFFIKIQANSLNVGASFGVHTEWACRTRLVRQDFALFSWPTLQKKNRCSTFGIVRNGRTGRQAAIARWWHRHKHRLMLAHV